MRKFIKTASAALLAFGVTTGSFAQDQKVKPDARKSEEIIIRKKGGKTEKMTIVVDGDDVTINGKPVDEFSTPDITVTKRERPFAYNGPAVRSFRGPAINFNGSDDLMAPPAHNKAMLGVLTEKSDVGGVKVKDVTKESAAEKAGLLKGDIITKVDTETVNNPRDLVEAIGKYKPSDKVNITYKRDGKEGKTAVILGENTSRDFSFNLDDRNFNFNIPEVPEPPMENFNFTFNRKPKIGLQIQDMEEGKGAKVNDVDAESPASKAGLKEGDVITQVDGKDVEGVDELRDQMKELEEGQTVKLTYKRDGKTQTAEVKIPKKIKTANL